MGNKYWFYWDTDEEIYFECGFGWYPIILKAFDKILEIVGPTGNTDSLFGFKVNQVKEKWGGLRIYTSYVNDEVEKVIEEAEHEASVTCEFCGAKTPDVALTLVKGWYSTLCKNCLDGSMLK